MALSRDWVVATDNITRAAPVAGTYHLTAQVRIPGDGDWGYLSIDPPARRLYITHGDRIEVLDIERNGDSEAIIRAIAELGASLGIATTAEGIETPEQLELVRRAGCTEVQGYLLSKPRPAAEVLELIAGFGRKAAAA